MQQGLMELVFPVGSTYITQSNTNPNTILNFGTWERLKGKVCVGLDEDDSDGYFNEIGKEGGEKKHTQTINEMPTHSHKMNTSSQDGTNLDGYFKVGSYNQDGTNLSTANEGKNQPMNITQPYQVVGYMWIRRA